MGLCTEQRTRWALRFFEPVSPPQPGSAHGRMLPLICLWFLPSKTCSFLSAPFQFMVSGYSGQKAWSHPGLPFLSHAPLPSAYPSPVIIIYPESNHLQFPSSPTNTLTIILTSLLKSSSAHHGLPVSTVVSSKAFLSPSLIFWKLSHGFSAQKKIEGFALAYKAWHRLPSSHLSDFITCCFPPLLFPLQTPWPPCSPAGLFLAGLCL